MEELIQSLTSGLLQGSFYALVALGFSLLLGVSRAFNLAHGDLIILGSYITWGLFNRSGWHPLLLLVITLLLVSLAGIFPPFFFRRLPQPFTLNSLVITFGLSLFLQNLYLGLFTANYRTAHYPPFDESLPLGFLHLPWAKLYLFALSLVLVTLLYYLLWRTTWGRALRAAAQDREAASMVGINLSRVDLFTYTVSAALAGAGGALYLFIHYISPFSGLELTILALALTIMAGVGRIGTVLIAGLLFGVVESLSISYLGPTWRDLALNLWLIAALLYRKDSDNLVGQH